MTWAKEWRILSEMSQTEVAQRLGMHVNTYIRKEREPGGFTLSEVQAFAEIANKDPADIFLRKESTKVDVE